MFLVLVYRINNGQPYDAFDQISQNSFQSLNKNLPPLKNQNKSIQEKKLETSLTDQSDFSMNYQIKDLEREMMRIREENTTLR